MTRPSPRKVGKALPLRVVRAALKADRDRLIRLVVDYTKKERANVEFVVPTGNFGNIFAGWLLLRMGVPVKGFKVATKRRRTDVAAEE